MRMVKINTRMVYTEHPYLTLLVIPLLKTSKTNCCHEVIMAVDIPYSGLFSRGKYFANRSPFRIRG